MLNKLCYRVFPSLCVFVWTDENDLKTLGMDTYFFRKTGKRSSFSKISCTCGRFLKEKYLEKTADILRREIKCRLFSQAKKKEAAVVYYTITRM